MGTDDNAATMATAAVALPGDVLGLGFGSAFGPNKHVSFHEHNLTAFERKHRINLATFVLQETSHQQDSQARVEAREHAEENAFAICPAMRWPPWLHMIPDIGYVSGLA